MLNQDNAVTSVTFLCDVSTSGKLASFVRPVTQVAKDLSLIYTKQIHTHKNNSLYSVLNFSDNRAATIHYF